MIIALDGPAGSGKSTIAKLIAKQNNISYLDTGAMYRMCTLYLLNNNVDLKDELAVEAAIKNINLNIIGEDFYLNDQLVNTEIRSIDVTRNVSVVAAIKAIRVFLVEKQQEIGEKADCILDGRDIGTVVFPNADYKFFLTASAEVRAKRRFDQNEGGVNAQSYEEILTDIIKRDEIDSTRKESPLKKAEDAIEIDSSSLSIAEVCDEVYRIINQ